MADVRSTESLEIPSLLFRVGGFFCVLPITAVVETMRPLPIQPFIDAPVGVAGMAIIRGKPVPVLLLAALLGSQLPVPARFITVTAGANQIALAVDAVLGLKNLNTASMQLLPGILSETARDVAVRIGTLDADLLLLLDTARLIQNAEAAMAHSGFSM